MGFMWQNTSAVGSHDVPSMKLSSPETSSQASQVGIPLPGNDIGNMVQSLKDMGEN